MNDAGTLVEAVLEGIEAAVAAGFFPVKINAVIQRGVNEHAIEELARRFAGPAYVVRFIEYMDVGNTNGWRSDEVVPAGEILDRLAEMGGGLVALGAQSVGEVARRYRTAAGGEIGVIASVTQPFCQDCTRARLSAEGRLFTCLFGTAGVDLRGPLRAGANDAELREIVRGVWSVRDDRYSEIRSAVEGVRDKVEMSAIGG